MTICSMASPNNSFEYQKILLALSSGEHLYLGIVGGDSLRSGLVTAPSVGVAMRMIARNSGHSSGGSVEGRKVGKVDISGQQNAPTI